MGLIDFQQMVAATAEGECDESLKRKRQEIKLLVGSQ